MGKFRLVLLFSLLSALRIQAPLFAQTPTLGLLRNDAGSAGGYTLFAPLADTNTYLVDACGRVVNTWHSSYLPGVVAYLLEDGTMLRTCRIMTPTVAVGGGRLERRAWDNTLLWSWNYYTNQYRQHHDIRLLPNGNILLLCRETLEKADCIAQGRNPALVGNNGLSMEYVIEVRPILPDSAEIVWEWHSGDHLIQDFDAAMPNYGVVEDHPELLDFNFSPDNNVDWLHANSVNYHAGFDQVILSVRHANELWVIDHSTTTAEAAGHTGGVRGHGGDFLYRWGNPAVYRRGDSTDQQMWKQHDAHWIPEGLPGAGQILVFDNGYGRPGGSYSAALSFTPPSDAQGNYPILNPGEAWGPAIPDWSYTASPDPFAFYSWNVSNVQRLANGNSLICAGAGGRIFEIDSLENIVWEYIVPTNNGTPAAQGSVPANNQIFRAYRYLPDFPGLQGQDLNPGLPLELNPLPGSGACFVSRSEPGSALLHIHPNPFGDALSLDLSQAATLSLINAQGQVVYRLHAPAGDIHWQVPGLSSGLYLLRADTETGHITQRLLHY